jgi:hypothetical protein
VQSRWGAYYRSVAAARSNDSYIARNHAGKDRGHVCSTPAAAARRTVLPSSSPWANSMGPARRPSEKKP